MDVRLSRTSLAREKLRIAAAPIFIVLGDADGIRYEHALELFRREALTPPQPRRKAA